MQRTTTILTLTLAVTAVLTCAVAAAQSPASAFNRGSSLQAWQDPGHAALIAKCKVPPKPFSIGGRPAPVNAPPEPPLPASVAIPGVIAAGQAWKVVWSWEGNNADGPIAGDKGTVIFANNDADNVMQLDPATGLATVIHDKVNTGGAVSRSKNGALLAVSRGLNGGVLQLEPQRKMLADKFNGEPFACVGGVINDLTADSRGGAYVSITAGGLFYASPQGVVTRYGKDMSGANGVILSADEKILYATNGPVVMAFDVQPDGSLTNEREFAKLRSGRGGDGSAIDAEGRLYVATGTGVDVFRSNGDFLGTIAGIPGMHGVAFGGPDKKTLFAIILSGTWGTPSARNRIVAIPVLAQGYLGRAK